eukprot:gene23359-30617_t
MLHRGPKCGSRDPKRGARGGVGSSQLCPTALRGWYAFCILLLGFNVGGPLRNSWIQKSSEPLYTVDNCAQLYLFSDYSSIMSTQIKVVRKSGAKAKAAPKKTALEKTRGTIKNPGTWQEGDQWQPGDSDRFVYITENNLQMMRSGPCFHCRSTNAPAWRRNLDELYCNKCGLKGRRRALKAGDAVKKKKAKSADALGADADAAAVNKLPPGGKRRRKTSSQGKAAATTTTAAAKGGGSAMALQQQQQEEEEGPPPKKVKLMKKQVLNEAVYATPMVVPLAAGVAASSGDSPANSADGYSPTHRHDGMGRTNAVYGGSGISDGVEEMNREPKNSSDEGCWGGADSMKFLMSQLAELPLEFIDTDSPVVFTCFDHV